MRYEGEMQMGIMLKTKYKTCNNYQKGLKRNNGFGRREMRNDDRRLGQLIEDVETNSLSRIR